jgi:hypothetical protein
MVRIEQRGLDERPLAAAREHVELQGARARRECRQREQRGV